MAYYLHDGKGAVGPFEPADLLKRPGFGADTLIFPAGATTADAWKPAGSYPDVAAALKPVPPPPPAAPAPKPLSEITLILPPPAKPAETRAPEEPAAPAAAPAEEPAPALASPSEKLILIVDDDEGVRSLVEICAAKQGFQTATAVNGLDAAAKLAARPADLIVTDLMMPGQGGYEFLRALQAEGGARVPVIVVTGGVLNKSTIEMIRQEANVVEFIAKPIRAQALVAAFHKNLGTAPR